MGIFIYLFILLSRSVRDMTLLWDGDAALPAAFRFFAQ